MRAGHVLKSIRPSDGNREDCDVMANGVDSDADNEGIEGVMNEMGGKPCEKIAMQREDDVIQNLRDP